MKISTFVAVVALLFSANSFGASELLDEAYLRSCGKTPSSTIELRKADNGNLSIQFRGLDTNECGNLKLFDASSKKKIKTYKVNGSNNNYTLSKDQRSALSDDCKVGVRVYGQNGTPQETYFITLGWWCVDTTPTTPAKPDPTGYTFEVSNAGNCKLMKNGVYQNINVKDEFCQISIAGSNASVSYAWSRNDNCKLMVDGEYSNQNVADRFCNPANYVAKPAPRPTPVPAPRPTPRTTNSDY